MTLRADMIKHRVIHLAIPAQTNKEQRLQLQRVVEYGRNRNITVKITEIELNDFQSRTRLLGWL